MRYTFYIMYPYIQDSLTPLPLALSSGLGEAALSPIIKALVEATKANVNVKDKV
jgi:hypothetical protein